VTLICPLSQTISANADAGDGNVDYRKDGAGETRQSVKPPCTTSQFAMGRLINTGYGYDRHFFIGATYGTELWPLDNNLDDLVLLLNDDEAWLKEHQPPFIV